MNGFNGNPRSMADERQPPPSIPPLSQLAINRPYPEASPSPSHLPPLAGHNYPSSSYTPTHLSRPPNGSQMPPPTSSSFATDSKTANLSQIAPQPSNAPPNGQSYAPYMPAYSSAPPHNFQSLPPTSAPSNGAPALSGYYPPTLQQAPPPYGGEQGGHQPHLLPPFNPQLPPGQVGGRPPADRPVPVVGSQGRRGILPSLPGRASAVGPENTAKNVLANSVRRADGKYECQFCNKSYLHLKHLKRHHLRHTGERPYQCYLCQETFCRSDILKRHFQKCSLRRGNPTGATHLTHAQAHLRRGSQGPVVPVPSNQLPSNGAPGQGPAMPPSSYRPGWPQNGHSMIHDPPADSTRSSRSSSVVHRPGSSADERKPFNGIPGQGPQTGNTSLDTSPSSTHDDRKYAQGQFPYSRELPPAPAYHEAQHAHQPPAPYPNYFGSAPPPFPGATSQSESYPGFGYNGQAPNGYRYPPQQDGQPPQYNGEQTYNPYSQYFQPGSHDPVMSYHQQ